MARLLTEHEWNQYVVDTQKSLSVVDFFADWCQPCKVLEPTLEKIEHKFFSDAEFFKVNVDDEPRLGSQFSIRSIPTILVLNHGKVVGRLVGLVSESVIEAEIKSALDKIKVP